MSSISINPQLIKLSNGIRLIVDKMSYVDSVCINVSFNVGVRSEDSEKVGGISHFLEHMMFKGTKTKSCIELTDQIDAIGGECNAYTDIDHTCYHIKVLKEYTYIAMALIADMVQNSIYPEDAVEKEKFVIQQEISGINDRPLSFAWERYMSVAYPAHNVGKPIIGTHESVSAITQDDLLRHHNKHYNSENIIIVISGNVNEDDVKVMVENLMNSLPNITEDDESTKAGRARPQYVGGDTRTQRDSLEQVTMIMGFDGCSLLDENRYVQKVATNIIGNGMSSRLFREIRDKAGLVYGIKASSDMRRDFGSFCIYSFTTPDNVNKVIDLSLEQLYNVSNEVYDDEMQRAIVSIKTDIIMAYEDPDSRAAIISRDYSVFGRFVPLSEILSKIESITLADISQFIRNMLIKNCKSDTGIITLSTIGPISSLQSYDGIIVGIKNKMNV